MRTSSVYPDEAQLLISTLHTQRRKQGTIIRAVLAEYMPAVAAVMLERAQINDFQQLRYAYASIKEAKRRLATTAVRRTLIWLPSGARPLRCRHVSKGKAAWCARDKVPHSDAPLLGLQAMKHTTTQQISVFISHVS